MKSKKRRNTNKDDKCKKTRNNRKKKRTLKVKKIKPVTETGFNKLNCAPGNGDKEYTCYKTTSLDKIKLKWNSRHPDYKITDTDPKIIWETLRNRMEQVCNNEACWLKQLFTTYELDNELLHYTFSPPAPNSWIVNPNEWLSSLDIIAVMKQFENQYKCFDFIGPSPIDYDTHYESGECVWKELCEFSLKKQIKQHKMKVGIIFNLDPHYKSGSHWVSLFINIGKEEIYYFDSVGEEPPQQIKKFIKEVIKQGNKLHMNIKQIINKKQHQYGETECGMYSLYFIINMLNGVSFDIFQNERITDKLMLEFRDKYFNKNI